MACYRPVVDANRSQTGDARQGCNQEERAMNRDVVVVHPGVQHSADLAASLDHAGRLVCLATRLQVGHEPRWPWNIAALRSRIPRRVSTRLPDTRILRIGAFEEILLRALSGRVGMRRYRALDRLSTRRFVEATLARLGPEVRVVVGTDTASLELFQRLAVERPDIARVLDVSHPLDIEVQALIKEDANRWSLDPTAYDDFHPGPPKDQRAEVESADVVLVASEFSESTFDAFSLSPGTIQRVPYAVDQSAVRRADREADQPLRLLALGAMSERKGMTLLLRAMRSLEESDVPVRLTIAGRASSGYKLPQLPSNTSYVGAPSFEKVQELYAGSDVLVLPSMCEGFGRTLLEALAAGLAVITTERSGGPDVLLAAPSAPITIVPAAERDTLSSVLAAYVARPEQFIRPLDAIDAAKRFSTAEYERRLQHAIAVATGMAEARLQGRLNA
jgi:glycosyltransferase involved in cell wall biosynthesis